MRSRSVSLSGNGTIFLGGPPLVKASTGEEVSAEAMDGTNERPGPAMSSYVQLCPAMSSYVQLCPMDGYMIYVLHHVASCWVDGGVAPLSPVLFRLFVKCKVHMIKHERFVVAKWPFSQMSVMCNGCQFCLAVST